MTLRTTNLPLRVTRTCGITYTLSLYITYIHLHSLTHTRTTHSHATQLPSLTPSFRFSLTHSHAFDCCPTSLHLGPQLLFHVPHGLLRNCLTRPEVLRTCDACTQVISPKSKLHLSPSLPPPECGEKCSHIPPHKTSLFQRQNALRPTFRTSPALFQSEGRVVEAVDGGVGRGGGLASHNVSLELICVLLDLSDAHVALLHRGAEGIEQLLRVALRALDLVSHLSPAQPFFTQAQQRGPLHKNLELLFPPHARVSARGAIYVGWRGKKRAGREREAGRAGWE